MKKKIIILWLLGSLDLKGLSNLTQNDPNPVYSSFYPYVYLATKQKANIQEYIYAYPVDKFRISISGFRQAACTAVNLCNYWVNCADLNGRYNILGLFYNYNLAQSLYNALSIKTGTVNDETGFIYPWNSAATSDSVVCYNQATDPRLQDRNNQFGFWSTESTYTKYGIRLESEIILLDDCFDSLGLKIQTGLVNVQQIAEPQDFTCQALGTTMIAWNGQCPSSDKAGPLPQAPIGITPPFSSTTVNANGVVFCNQDPNVQNPNCVPLQQTFTAPDTSAVCFTYTPDCKRFIIDSIMKQTDKIFDLLGIDFCNYNRTGLEDLRAILFWRHIFIINELADSYPRVTITPFLEAGGAIPMAKKINYNNPLAIPIGNNGHWSLGAMGGLTIDFPDVIDISFSAQFTYFFPESFGNYRFPNYVRTQNNELFAVEDQGIFPFVANVSIQPGMNWNVGMGIQAYHFIDNLSIWIEYTINHHMSDSACILNQPVSDVVFNISEWKKRSAWESQLVNAGLNYDLSDDFEIGLVWQAPAVQHNAFRSNTVLGTVTYIY